MSKNYHLYKSSNPSSSLKDYRALCREYDRRKKEYNKLRNYWKSYYNKPSSDCDGFVDCALRVCELADRLTATISFIEEE